MIGTYPPKYGLYDPITNRPIFYDGIVINGEEEQDGRGIYDSTIRGKYLAIRIQTEGFWGNPSPPKEHPDYGKWAAYFTGVGLTSGLENAYGYTSLTGAYDLGNTTINRRVNEPDRFKRTLFTRKAVNVLDWALYLNNILYVIEIGKINGFRYGTAAVRFALLAAWDYSYFSPEEMPTGYCPPVTSWGYSAKVYAFIMDNFGIAERSSINEVSSSLFDVPSLSYSDYGNTSIPGAESLVATIHVDKNTDEITLTAL